MPVTLVNMFGTGTGGAENALAVIDVPDDAVIEGADWACQAALNADAEFFVAELSFISTQQNNVNDARGLISMVAARCGLLTSGSTAPSLNKFVPLNLIVAGGERLFLHANSTAGVVSRLNCVIALNLRRGIPRRSQRRR